MLRLLSAMEQQKTRRLSLSLKCLLSERFQAVAGEEISQSKKPYVPDNRWRSTDWAVRMFEQWRDFYNSKQNETKCPRNILMTEAVHFRNGSEKREWRLLRKWNFQPINYCMLNSDMSSMI